MGNYFGGGNYAMRHLLHQWEVWHMDVNIVRWTDEISYRMTEFRTFYPYNSIFLPNCYAGGIYQSWVCVYITPIIKIIRKPVYIS